MDFEASLVYRVTARATQRNPVSKSNQTNERAGERVLWLRALSSSPFSPFLASQSFNFWQQGFSVCIALVVLGLTM